MVEPNPDQQTIPFVTDDEIIRRLQQAENGITHLEYQAGVIKRELATLRAKLEPREPA